MISFCVILTLFLICSENVNSTPVLEEQSRFYPVITVAGFGGAQVFDNPSDGADASQNWITLSKLLFPGTLVDSMSLDLAKILSKTHSNYENNTIFPGTDHIWATSYLGKLGAIYSYPYMNTLYNFLLNEPYYKVGKTLLAVTFDWRRAFVNSARFMASMQRNVELLYENDNSKKVVLIGHSLGGIMNHYFLMNMAQQWKDKYIHKVIVLASPLGGAVKPWRSIVEGDGLGVDQIIDKTQIRRMLNTFPSTAFLLPHPEIFGDEVIMSVKEGNYVRNFTAKQIPEFYDYMGSPYSKKLYELVSKQRHLYRQSPGVEIVCIYGFDQETTSKFTLPERPTIDVDRRRYGSRYEFTGTSARKTSLGDGTVNLKSLRQCGQYSKSTTHELYDVDHLNILESNEAMEIVMRNVGY